MNSRDLYKIWAPSEARWTNFAKPALFVHASSSSNRPVKIPGIPLDVKIDNERVAVIVDLPGETGVTSGLGLAEEGFRPVPLYNSVHEVNVNKFGSVIDNSPIIEALESGADILKNLEIKADAPPAFLLDYNRDNSSESYSKDLYDNRWNVDFEDLPEYDYLMGAKIQRVILWTHDKVHEDLEVILQNYLDHGIKVSIYVRGKISPYKGGYHAKIKGLVENFESAIFSLKVITVLAFINLISQFFLIEEPFLWTTPSIPWLTYLWVSEDIGDIFAVLIPITYLVLYLSLRKKRSLVVFSFAFFLIDVIVFYIYAFVFYGAGAFTGYSSFYGAIVFIPPILLLMGLGKGLRVFKALENINKDTYLLYLDHLKSESPRYLGYDGYGGTGRGGYRGYGRGGYGGRSGG